MAKEGGILSDFDPLRLEIAAARDLARAKLARALCALELRSESVEEPWNEVREALLSDVAAKLHDLLVQEELLAALDNMAMNMIYDVEPSLQRLARKREAPNDGGSTPLA